MAADADEDDITLRNFGAGLLTTAADTGEDDGDFRMLVLLLALSRMLSRLLVIWQRCCCGCFLVN